MKLHRKIEHNLKVCLAQKLGYYALGQGHNHVRCQIELKIRSEMCKTLVPWLCSRSQPGIKAIIRDLRGHLLHTITFLVLFGVRLYRPRKHLSGGPLSGLTLKAPTTTAADDIHK